MPEPLPRTLVVTNDFPPRHGGVEQYVYNLVAHLPPERVTVTAPAGAGDADFDAAQPFRVDRSTPGPLGFVRPDRRRVLELVRETGSEVVLLASGFATTGVGPALKRGGVPFVVITHGVEYWVATVPGFRQLFRRQLTGASRVTVISEFIRRRVAPAVPEGVPVSLCPPAVDERRFRPDIDGARERARFGLDERPVVLCVSRLVARKGQDVLIKSMAAVRREVPDATLLIVGEGPRFRSLQRLAAEAPPGSVVFAGAVPAERLPAIHAAADVFAMPCRSRLGGLEVEGFGIVYLEAAASGKAAIAGRSGGAAEAVEEGVTGLVVDGRSTAEVAGAIVRLLTDPVSARAMGAAGRERVEDGFTWDGIASRMSTWLAEACR